MKRKLLILFDLLSSGAVLVGAAFLLSETVYKITSLSFSDFWIRLGACVGLITLARRTLRLNS